jgi:preprotein translocase SecE subunit
MARDRQRAKARKQRREPTPPKRDEGNGAAAPEPDHLHRENVPGPVDHTGEVDEFEAALVAGAGGEPVEDPDEVDREAVGDVEAPPPAGGPPAATAASPGEDAPGKGGNRFWNFLKACWAELQRVQWPDRRQVGQATMVVIGFVIIAGVYLGLADWAAEQVVDLII